VKTHRRCVSSRRRPRYFRTAWRCSGSGSPAIAWPTRATRCSSIHTFPASR